jgi:hypothetical protein
VGCSWCIELVLTVAISNSVVVMGRVEILEVALQILSMKI